MKLSKFIIPMLVVFLMAVTIFVSGCDRENNTVAANDLMQSGIISEEVIASLPAEDVSDAETAGLVFMREEEKLARDVYLTLYSQWSVRVFSNISRSEQMHTDAIALLLEKYEIEDPVQVDSLGVFKNEALQALYDTLLVQGKQSLVEALKVGALIEEVDIRDIQKELDENVDNQDIAYVYENLMRGSRNHLRAFVNNLSAQGVEYAPQILSQEDYLAIINSDWERGGNR